MSPVSESVYSKTCLKRNLKGAEHFSADAMFPFNAGYNMIVTGPENISV
jgi:hypothetical protein